MAIIIAIVFKVELIHSIVTYLEFHLNRTIILIVNCVFILTTQEPLLEYPINRLKTLIF